MIRSTSREDCIGRPHIHTRPSGSGGTTEFQNILNHMGISRGSYYRLSYVGLARAAEIAGDTARARKAYQDYLTLWKDGDPDIPILKEASQEYAKLK